MLEDQNKYRHFFEAASDGIFIQDSTGIIVDCNENGARLHGLSRDEVIGKLPHAFFPEKQPDGKVSAYIAHEKMLAALSGKPQQFDFKSKRTDGAIFDAEVILNRIDYCGAPHIHVVIRDITLRKQAEALLLRNQALMQNSMDGIHIMDIEGNVIDVNDAFCDMLGYTREEALRLNITDWNAEASPEVLRQRLRSFIGKKARFETTHRRKDGTLIAVEISTSGIEIDGKIYLHAVSRDITERKQAERALRHESMKNRMLLRGASDGIHILDYDGNVLEVSDSFCTMLGYAPVELIGMNVSQWDATMSYSKLIKDIREQIAHKDRRLFETRHRRKDGAIFDVEISSIPLELDGRTVLFNSSRDITERKQGAQALAESETKYRLLFETASDGIFLQDETGVFIDCNENGAKLIGVSRAEIVGMSPADISPERQPDGRLSAEVASEKFAAALNGQIQRFEYRSLRVDGMPFDAELTISRVDYQGIPCVQVVVRDITERKQKEAQIAESYSLLNATLESSNDAILVVDLNNTWVLHNKQFAELWHITDEMIATKNDRVALSYVLNQLEDPETFLNKVLELYATPEATSFDTFEFKDGKIIECYSMPQRIDGEVVGRVWSFHDVTKRIAVEKKMQELNADLTATLQAIPDLLFELNQNGDYINIWAHNPELLAAQKEILLDHTVNEMLPPEAAAIVMSALKETAEKGYSTGQVIKLNLPHGESWFELSSSVKPTTDESNMHFIMLSRDITERKQMENALQESEARFRNIMEHAPIGMATTTLDGHILVVNQAFCDMVGYGRDELETLTFQDITHPDDKTLTLADRQKLLNGEIESYQKEKRYLRKNGQVVWVLITSSIVRNESETPPYFIAQIENITQRKRAEEGLQITASVFDNIQEGIMITDVNNDIVDVNPAFTHITGYRREDVIGRNPELLSSGRQDNAFYAKMWEGLRQNGRWRGEVWNRRKSGDIYAEILSITAICDNDGKLMRYVAIFSDISLIKEHEAELIRVAHFDALTGAPNRVLLADRMKQAISQTAREEKMMAVCYLDLDEFKPINDTLGHEVGDEVLIEVAKRIENTIRGGDTFARLGGDEFVVLLLGLDQGEECVATLERLLSAIAQPITANNISHTTVSASIGVSMYPLDNENPDTLLRYADQAMYVAKRSGRNRFYFYDQISKTTT